MRIAVLDDWQDTVRTLPCFSLVADHDVDIWTDHTTDVDVLADRLRETEVLALIRERTPIGAELLDRLPKLRMITQVAVFPHIDIEAATRRGVIVSSYLAAGGGPSYPPAELTWGLILAAARRIPQEAAALKAGVWQAQPMGDGLRGKTLGIFGYGAVGSVVAGYGAAFGMAVQVWGRPATLARAQADGYPAAASQRALFRDCDVVSLHLRLVPETAAIVTAADLAVMKPTALLVNAARAQLIEPGALETALRVGRPGMAAVDVFEQEPIGGLHPLVAMPNVVATPHIGFLERDSFNAMFSLIFDQILAYTAGAPINVHNPQALG
ncbi:MAG: D-2-hydroxyacid dehydrogenase family protein [Mycobacteriaceae bacterium]|nr:D-2-hydroxyacid dehydrogenase family protein [Mycobacteriaceae bacterium]